MSSTDLLIVGSGPAGMAAGIAARELGLEVIVIDDQSSPGGQIWRSIGLTSRRDGILGPSYVEGRAVSERFERSGVKYQAGSQLWQVEPGFRAFVTRDGQANIIECKALVFATGAQERPTPFPGWTLPGVLTVGAAQILLKNAGQIPDGPVWIAGSGPLPLLYAIQLLKAGGKVGGYLDTTPAGQWRAALRHLPRALRASGELIKGLDWIAELKRRNARPIKGVTSIAALGESRIEAIRYRKHDGTMTTVEAKTLLVHEGVVPNIHAASLLDCELKWNSAQECFSPQVDCWGESSQRGVFIAGDGAGIAGAKAALLRGKLSALRVAVMLGRLDEDGAASAARPIRAKLDRELAVRPFLDAFFRPRREIFAPADETIVCRCEEVTAGTIRAATAIGRPGPNLVKASTRVGMGPCQGRQCGYTVTQILANAQGRSPSEIGYFHIRSPLKPVTLRELASLHQPLGE